MTQRIKNFKNVTTKRNNLRLFFQLTNFALFGIAVFAIMILNSGQTSAQSTCRPSVIVTEGDLAPGGAASFNVSIVAGSVTVDHVDGGTGLQSLTQVGTSFNMAAVNIPSPLTLGTFSPVAVTYTVTNPASYGFNLRAASTFHSCFIHVGCSPIPDPPPPTGCSLTQGYWKNHAEDWMGTSLMLGTVNYTDAQLLAILRTPVRGNGLISLSHQLIAAKLNVAAGASVPASVANAIAAADAMIGGLVVPPGGGGTLSTSSTGALTVVLDEYNKGNSSGGPRHCN